jgi:hypothetical protein
MLFSTAQNESVTQRPTVPARTHRSRSSKSPSTLLYSAKKKDSVLRTLQSFLLVSVVCAATAAILPACGSSDSGTTGGTAGAATGAAGATGTAGAAAGTGTAGAGAGTAGASGTLVGDATRGAALYTSKTCNSCHGDNSTVPPQPILGAGSLAPNITGSKFAGLGGGIGNWTEAQFHDAVRLAKNIDGTQLCILMQPFPATAGTTPGSVGVSDQDIADLYVFLEAQMATMALQGSYCAM